MKIIFIGGLSPVDRKEEFIKNTIGPFIYNADNFLYGFVNGLDFYYPTMDIISVPFIGNFPFNYKKIYQKGSTFSHKKGSNDVCISSIRIPFLGLLHRYKNISSLLFHKYKNNIEPICIIVSSVYTPALKAAVKFKKKSGSNVQICLIVPDLPQYVSNTSNPIYWFFKNNEIRLLKKLYRYVDKYVLLTNAMYEQLPIGNKPWICIEGIYDTNNIVLEDVPKESDKVILYTGGLSCRYGIRNLVEAFMLIPNKSYRLWLCGDGDYRNELLQKMKIDNRIKYYGQLSSQEVFILQKKATVLINPRTSDGEFTKYSFPSKTMEYLASGTPCISYKLPGIPDDYMEYLFSPNDETVNSLKEKIIEVCEMPSDVLIKVGQKAKQFIIDKKNSKVQMKKLYDLIEK